MKTPETTIIFTAEDQASGVFEGLKSKVGGAAAEIGIGQCMRLHDACRGGR